MRLSALAGVAAAVALASPALAAGAAPAAASVHPLTKREALHDITVAFLAIHHRGSTARFTTGAALLTRIDRAAPGLAGVFVGSRVGTHGHIGLGLTRSDRFVAICRLAGQDELIVRVGRSGDAAVTVV